MTKHTIRKKKQKNLKYIERARELDKIFSK